MALLHLDCTTEVRREQICREYEVHADDCITLYGERTVRSDANNRVIYDKYYQFSVFSRHDHKPIYVITCGSGAARHICKIINEPLPHSFNPFIQSDIEENNHSFQNEEVSEDVFTAPWNPMRKKLYYAVQLFIIRYQDIITPGTKIFRVLHSLSESHTDFPPQAFHFKSFSEVVIGFHTNLTQIIDDLQHHGQLRTFDFTDLDNYMSDNMNMPNNIFSAQSLD